MWSIPDRNREICLGLLWGSRRCIGELIAACLMLAAVWLLGGGSGSVPSRWRISARRSLPRSLHHPRCQRRGFGVSDSLAFAADGGWLAHFPLPIALRELGNSMNRSSLPPNRRALEFLKYYVIVCLRVHDKKIRKCRKAFLYLNSTMSSH